jgi:hypothetical protein
MANRRHFENKLYLIFNLPPPGTIPSTEDLGGLPKDFDGGQTWENLGGVTSPYTPVPEPSGSLLLLCSLAGGCLIRRRR